MSYASGTSMPVERTRLEIERHLAQRGAANGQRVGAWVAPQLESMYASGRMPALLPAADRQEAT